MCVNCIQRCRCLVVLMLQSNDICQEKSRQQTFVVDCKHLLSFVVGYMIENQLDLLMSKKVNFVDSEF